MTCDCKFKLLSCSAIIIKQQDLIADLIKIGVKTGDKLIVYIKGCANCNKKTASIETTPTIQHPRPGIMVNNIDLSFAERLIKENEINESSN